MDHSTDISSDYQRRYTRFIRAVVAVICVTYDCISSLQVKTPCMTSTQTGDRWVTELLIGHPSRSHNMLRMSKHIFVDLVIKLQDTYGLKASARTTANEVIAITIYILAQNESMRATAERFQHSTETICRLFARGINALIRLAMDIIQPNDRLFRETPAKIKNDARYMPFFKDCIGAIDGTHVHARIAASKQVPYIGRQGKPTQNVMAICDFNMCFTFVVPGWEGSAHDSRILHRAISERNGNFPHPPPGKYYLVDAGYPLQRGFLKPYPDTRYHLPDFARGNRPIQGPQELFNKSHSSLRCVIERTFGVWKKKWAILRDMPQYSFKKQVLIVVATMALHNFIRKHPSREDPEFEECENEENIVQHGWMEPDVIDADFVHGGGSTEMTDLRDHIASQLAEMATVR